MSCCLRERTPNLWDYTQVRALSQGERMGRPCFFASARRVLTLGKSLARFLQDSVGVWGSLFDPADRKL